MNDIVPAQQSLLELPPRMMAQRATEIADVLADIIERQKLYVTIQGKKHVKVDGWATMGSMLGLTVKEKEVKRHEDGTYEASVEICSFATGKTLGGASAICGVGEKRWANADEYARRSMSVTRAVGKAYRINFSWILTMAGYAATPAEEMPEEKETQQTAPTYDGATAQQEKIKIVLQARKVPEELWGEVHERMLGRKGYELPRIINDVMSQHGSSVQ